MRDRHGLPCVRDFQGMELPRIAALAIALASPLVVGCGERRLSATSAATAPQPASSAPASSAPSAPQASGPAASPGAVASGKPRAPTSAELARYGWLAATDSIRALDETIAAPDGFARVHLDPTSFGAFLRGLPLRPAGSGVHAHDGRVLWAGGDERIAAVVAMDQGTRDLQQCADTAIRLHAEWLWARGRGGDIGYHFTSGDLSTWSAYAAGDRPIVEARSVAWSRRAQPTSGRAAFRAYLDQVFTYAGTVSLAREAAVVAREDLAVGDVLVLPGGPGHTVVVLDLAIDGAGHRRALLGQGFMPAQEAHVLADGRTGPWFDLDVDAIPTPFWSAPFPWSSLRRMRTATGHTE